MVVGTLRLSLLIRGSHSLKEKRMVMRSLKDRLKGKFNVSVAETAFQDVWQRAEIGVAAVGNDGPFVHSVLDEIVAYVYGFHHAELVDVEKSVEHSEK